MAVVQSSLIITEVIYKLKALGKTVIISSHIFSTLRDTCDEIHHLKHSRFTPYVGAESFNALEQEMKATNVGSRLDNLLLY